MGGKEGWGNDSKHYCSRRLCQKEPQPKWVVVLLTSLICSHQMTIFFLNVLDCNYKIFKACNVPLEMPLKF